MRESGVSPPRLSNNGNRHALYEFGADCPFVLGFDLLNAVLPMRLATVGIVVMIADRDQGGAPDVPTGSIAGRMFVQGKEASRDAAASIIFELPEANSIVAWLKTDGLASRLKAELSDSSNFGTAKSLFMMGKEAGYDMTSQAGMDAFMTAFNQSLSSTPPPRSNQPPSAGPAPLGRGQRVGRNDPCPCGSGKKFKKCCG